MKTSENDQGTTRGVVAPGVQRDKWPSDTPAVLRLRTFPTTRPAVLSLERQPLWENRCGHWCGVFICNRASSHNGRHARVRYGLGGRVRAVWGAGMTLTAAPKMNGRPA